MRIRPVVGFVRFLSVLSGGLFAGFLVTVLVFELSLRRFDRLVYTQVRQVELPSGDHWMVGCSPRVETGGRGRPIARLSLGA
jgi:hypothetical protein